MRMLWIILAFITFVLLFMMLSGAMPLSNFNNDDDLAQLSCLVLIGLLVISALLGSGLRLGEWLRYGLMWSVLIFVLVFGYHNRFQLQDFGSQLTMGVMPLSPLSRTAENSPSVTLTRALNGHFETQALVNHQTHIYFMLDTGASSVVLSHEDARQLGIDVDALVYSIPTSTANGEARAAQIVLASLKIGAIERQNVRALVAQPQALSDSLLGMNFLNSLSGYTVRADQLTLID